MVVFSDVGAFPPRESHTGEQHKAGGFTALLWIDGREGKANPGCTVFRLQLLNTPWCTAGNGVQSFSGVGTLLDSRKSHMEWVST